MKTIFLSEQPATVDELGAHSRIARLIHDDIVDENEGRSIALIGDWGSGKSTIISLLGTELLNTSAVGNIDARVLVYDAWAHQGDTLRRSFLDDLIGFLKSGDPDKRILTDKEAENFSDRAWNRVEITKTTAEPVLRRHAIILLFALGLVPLGLKLLDLPPTGDIELNWRFWTGILLLTGFLWLTIFFWGIKQIGGPRTKEYWFGQGHNEKTFSITSFFFEKIQTRNERKTVRAPTDSILEFKDIFNDLLETAHKKNPRLRIVLIIDNIDRIPPASAREFWATLQTFFEPSAGAHRKPRAKYWLIAPFSEKALSYIFSDDKAIDDETKLSFARDFVNKTFGVNFRVPAPILSNWRRYLLNRLKEAFPEHREVNLRACRDFFDISRPKPLVGVSPREIKFFVNRLVALYRERGDDVPLVLLAAFLLKEKEFLEKDFSAATLSLQEANLINWRQWREAFCAIHYGANFNEGAQLLMEEPIVQALRKGDTKALAELEKESGFHDVLTHAVRNERATWNDGNGDKLSVIAICLSNLTNPDSPELEEFWNELGDELNRVKGWGSLATSPKDGLRAILSHTEADKRGLVAKRAIEALSRSVIPEPDTDTNSTPARNIKNWIDAVIGVLDFIQHDDDQRVTAHAMPSSAVEIIQQLGAAGNQKILKSIRLSASSAEITSALVTGMGAGRFIREAANFVHTAKALNLELGWPIIIRTANDRLRKPETGIEEFIALIRLLISCQASDLGGEPQATLLQLSRDGILSDRLSVHSTSKAARAAVFLATIIANPKFERHAQYNQSVKGDTIWAKFRDNAPDQDTISEMTALISANVIGGRVFRIGAENAPLAKITSAITKSLMDEGYRCRLPDHFIIEKKDFLKQYETIVPPREFLASLVNRDELISSMITDGFKIERSQLYLWTVEGEETDSNTQFIKFLEEGILPLTKSDWVGPLTNPGSDNGKVIDLATELKKRNDKFELAIDTRDALLEAVRSDSNLDSGVVQKVWRLIKKEQRTTLAGDLIEDMMSSNIAVIDRIIGLLGSEITYDALSAADMNRVVSRILTPILTQPAVHSADWMAQIINQNPNFGSGVRQTIANEFTDRLNKSLADDKISEPIKEKLEIIAKQIG